MWNDPRRQISALAFVAALLTLTLLPGAAHTASPPAVVLSEIAWMGTAASPDDEWIELYNNGADPVDLSGWALVAADGTPNIALSGTIPAGGYYLLEYADDGSLPGVVADQIYTGPLEDEGEQLFLRDGSSVLVDEVACGSGWYAGHARARVPMARVDPLAPGTEPGNWTHSPRCGTPTNASGDSYECPYVVASVGQPLEYTVYLNEQATTTASASTALAPMEEALLALIDGAQTSIDAAMYALGRQSVVGALIGAYNRGVTVRVVADDQAASGLYSASYQALINAGIQVVTDATTEIQHNTFFVVDGSVVWTGSVDLTDTGLTLDASDSIAVTDAVLASNYTAEFEEMWSGDFHEDKTVNTIQHLEYDDALVENYFSPTDLSAFEMWRELGLAKRTIHLATFSWTDELLSQQVQERIDAGVQVFGLWDQLGAEETGSQDDMLCAAGAHIGIENLPAKVRHQFAIVDVDGDDPVVILGSSSWTEAAAYENDENTLIVHSRELAQTYYAEWQRLWGTLDRDRICNPFTVYLATVRNNWTPMLGPSFAFGIQAHGDHGLPQIVSSVQDLGLSWAKQQVRWEDIEGTPGNCGWAGLDAIADAYNQAGFKVLFSVTAAPDWTRPGKTGNGPPDNYQHFYRFVGEMAGHFRGRVHAYEIWNEPNMKGEWEGAPLSAADYVRLLAGAYQAVKAADPAALVVTAAPIPTGINDGVLAIDDRVWVQQMYSAGVQLYCDAIGAHPYGFANPPDVLYLGGDFDPSRGWDDHPSFFFRNTMEDYYRIMVAYGDGAKRIWATEFGWPTVDGMDVAPNPGQEYADDINQAQQADYTVRAFTWAYDWGHAGVMVLWNLNMWPAAGKFSEMSKYSIVRWDWSPRPVYIALKYTNKQSPSTSRADWPATIWLPIVTR
jgi:phosphatidylserine/phosphatidylglycerophosphate/cardiolipin synthase-like enzyme